MKITDPDIIKNGEKDLIQAVTDDLDLDAVQEILKKRMDAATLSPKGGQIIVHNNEIAFKVDFHIQLSGSLMFDREGNYIPESSQTDDKKPDHEPDDLEIPVSEDLDLEDIDLNETLEEVGQPAPADDNDEKNLASVDIEDEDFNDILEESREFWEPEKE